MGTKTIPLAKDIQKLSDIPGTVSLRSMGHVRELEREKEPDHPTLAKVESDLQRLRGQLALTRERMFKIGKCFQVKPYSIMLYIFFAWGEGRIGTSHRIVCIDLVT